jgi:hypothetical protein
MKIVTAVPRDQDLVIENGSITVWNLIPTVLREIVKYYSPCILVVSKHTLDLLNYKVTESCATAIISDEGSLDVKDYLAIEPAATPLWVDNMYAVKSVAEGVSLASGIATTEGRYTCLIVGDTVSLLEDALDISTTLVILDCESRLNSNTVEFKFDLDVEQVYRKVVKEEQLAFEDPITRVKFTVGEYEKSTDINHGGVRNDKSA